MLQPTYIFFSKRGQPLYNGQNNPSQCVRFQRFHCIMPSSSCSHDRWHGDAPHQILQHSLRVGDSTTAVAWKPNKHKFKIGKVHKISCSLRSFFFSPLHVEFLYVLSTVCCCPLTIHLYIFGTTLMYVELERFSWYTNMVYYYIGEHQIVSSRNSCVIYQWFPP